MNRARTSPIAERLFEAVTQALALAGLVCLTGIALAIVLDVVLRLAFSAPIEGLSEVTSLVAAVTIASFFPLSLRNNGHAKIRLLGKLFGRRGEHVLDALAALVTLAFFCVLVWQMARYTAELSRAGERTWILQLDPTPWWWVATVLLGVAAIAQVSKVIACVAGGTPAPATTPKL